MGTVLKVVNKTATPSDECCVRMGHFHMTLATINTPVLTGCLELFLATHACSGSKQLALCNCGSLRNTFHYLLLLTVAM